MTDSKDIATHFVAAFNAHDERALTALHASDIKFEAPGFKASNAHEATAYAMRWLKGFPNGKMTVYHEVVSGPWVVQEVVMEGTNTGPLDGPGGKIQPTNRKLVSKGIQVLKIEDGKITETRIYFDQLDQMAQLGLMPVPATV
jgi:ketosteroid isomerase-like protein